MKRRITALLLALAMALPLTGCSLLERGLQQRGAPQLLLLRERADRDVLQPETYQELVNALLVLVDDHAAEGTIWLSPGRRGAGSRSRPSSRPARRCSGRRPWVPTPWSISPIPCRRITAPTARSSCRWATAAPRQQVKGIVHATSISALHALLTAAAENERRGAGGAGGVFSGSGPGGAGHRWFR